MQNSRDENLFSLYLEYSSGTEVPIFFHRWSMIAGLGAWLGRNFYFQHGHFKVYPNIYCMLLGSPGTRKSTAIKLVRNLLREAGYDTIAADKTTKEKFMLDLAGEGELNTDINDINLFGPNSNSEPCECFIAADEFNDFFGNGNIEFISLLGTLWDYSGTYKNRIKNGKSVDIYEPTISILGGNTPTGFSLAFPVDILGQGFFSRLLLIHGESNGKRITFPSAPSPEKTAELLRYLNVIKSVCVGAAKLSSDAEVLLDKIYRGWRGVNDIRFESYANRRFTHLLKLCLIAAAARASKEIETVDVIHANTVLSHTENLMPKALGEFGKAKHAAVSNKILQYLDSVSSAASLKDIWKQVHKDLDKLKDLSELLMNLQVAGKIQAVSGLGWLPRKDVQPEVEDGTVDYSILTDEERKLSL